MLRLHLKQSHINDSAVNSFKAISIERPVFRQVEESTRQIIRVVSVQDWFFRHGSTGNIRFFPLPENMLKFLQASNRSYGHVSNVAACWHYALQWLERDSILQRPFCSVKLSDELKQKARIAPFHMRHYLGIFSLR